MTDRITESHKIRTTDDTDSLHACAYDRSQKSAGWGDQTKQAQKSIDDMFGKLNIVDESKCSSKAGKNQVALEIVPGSSGSFGIGMTPNGSQVWGPMKDGKILGGGRIVLSPSGMTMSPTLLLPAPKA